MCFWESKSINEFHIAVALCVCVCVCMCRHVQCSVIFSLRAVLLWQGSCSDYDPDFAGTFVISLVKSFQESLDICNGWSY